MKIKTAKQQHKSIEFTSVRNLNSETLNCYCSVH